MFFKTDFLKNFAKITQKQLRRSLFLITILGPQQIFYRRLPRQLAQTLNGIWSSKKYSGNVYISLKTKSKHQVTYSKEKSNFEIALGAGVRGFVP